MIDNAQGIDEIRMSFKARSFCPLGEAWYTNDFEVVFVPNDCFPDYIDVDSWVRNNIDGAELIIEDAVSAVFEYLSRLFPKAIRVSSSVSDAAHFPVVVTKEGAHA